MSNTDSFIKEKSSKVDIDFGAFSSPEDRGSHKTASYIISQIRNDTLPPVTDQDFESSDDNMKKHGVTHDFMGHVDIVHGYPCRSLVNTLSGSNVFTPRSIGDSVLCTDLNDVKWGIQKLKSLKDKVKVFSKLYPDYTEAEIISAGKMQYASASVPFAYLPEDMSAWFGTGSAEMIPYDIITAVAKLITTYRGAENVAPFLDPFFYNNSRVPLKYKLGSSYGAVPYIPGKSKVNALALAYHWGLFSQLIERFRKNGRVFSKSIIDDTLSSIGYSDVQVRMAQASMMLHRVKYISSEKPLRIYSVNYEQLKLETQYVAFGYSTGWRNLQAVSCFLNLFYLGLSYLGSDFAHKTKGFDVGSMMLTTRDLASFLRLKSKNREEVDIYCTDFGGYDDSVKEGVSKSYSELLRLVFPLSSDFMYEFDQYITNIEQISSNFFDYAGITFFKRRYGIKTGCQDTTFKGSSINIMLNLWAISFLKKQKVSTTISECANFNGFHQNSKFFLNIKGDDNRRASVKGYLNNEEITDFLTEKGFDCKREKGSILLQQISEGNQFMMSDGYLDCPESLRNVECLKSWGYCLKKIPNKLYSAEYTLKDIRPARLAIYSNMIETQFSPIRAEVWSACLDMLNRHDKNVLNNEDWNFSSLGRYLSSSRGKHDMTEYAKSHHSSLEYLMEQNRRRMSGYGSVLDTMPQSSGSQIKDDLLKSSLAGMTSLDSRYGQILKMWDVKADDNNSYATSFSNNSSKLSSMSNLKQLFSFLNGYVR